MPNATRPTSRLYVNGLGNGVYRGHSQHPGVLNLVREHSLSESIDKSRVFKIAVVLLLLTSLVTPVSSYASAYSVDQLRVYAHSRIVNFDEFICLDHILIKESHYNYLATNGSHYGIGQMRSVAYQSKDPYTQIDLTIKYIHTRYKTMCSAYAYHRKHGYY